MPKTIITYKIKNKFYGIIMHIVIKIEITKLVQQMYFVKYIQ